jgi:adenylate cyclase
LKLHEVLVRLEIRLFLDDGETVFYAFPLLLALRYLAAHAIVPQPGMPDPEHLRLGQITLPPLEANDGGYVNADMRGYQFLLDFQGAPVSFQTFS